MGLRLGLRWAVFVYDSLSACVLSHRLQPALIYLIPCTLLPFVLLSCRRGDFPLAWTGPLPHFTDADPATLVRQL